MVQHNQAFNFQPIDHIELDLSTAFIIMEISSENNFIRDKFA